MATPAAMSEILDRLRRTVPLPDEAGLTDAQLLEAFLRRGDEAAVAALVRRHGPMVWGVCRRVLDNYQDAEDAFQTTFLVLVRKAASIHSHTLVANWLYGVAHRTARKARAAAARRRAREKQVTEMPEPAVTEPGLWRELQPLLDQELSLLPDRYRSVVVLCDLEGKTRKEAARQIGCPEGTVAGRLARARALLATRLARHGLTVSGGVLAAVLSEKAASAAVPTGVLSSTIQTACLVASGRVIAAGAVSARVATLTDGVLQNMLLAKVRVAMTLLVAVALLGVSVPALGHRLLAAREATADSKAESQIPPTGKSVVPTARPGNKESVAVPHTLADQEARRLAGPWAVRQVETKGEPALDDADLKEARITFAGNKAKVTGLSVLFVRDFSFKLDPSAKPRAMDVTFLDGPMKGKTFEGIYVARPDEVRICLRLTHPEYGRPKGFFTGGGTTLYTFVLGRADANGPVPERAGAGAARSAQTCRVTGSLTSTEYARAGGALERAIVSVWALPGRRQVAHSDAGGSEFAFDLPPGAYLLECTGVGSRGATFVPTEKKLVVRPGDKKVEVGAIDLPASEITKLFGKPAPELSGVVAWRNTAPLTLKGLKGKVVVLDFWGYYCSICLEHVPDLARLADKYRDRGLVVLTVHDSSVDSMDEVYQKTPALFRPKLGDLPVALDGNGPAGVFRSYGVRAVPTAVLIDAAGRVVRRFHHAGDPELDREIARLLKGTR